MKHCFFILLLFIIACKSETEQQLEFALQAAEENRTELEKVLKHYANDSLKLKAAKFLICNMPGHVSYVGQEIECYYQEAKPILLSDSLPATKVRMLEELYRKYPPGIIKKEQDVKIITADYLIHNIDRAFDDWQHGVYAQQISFEEFCEYLLPYKCIDYQALDNWRDTLCPIAEGAYEDFVYNRVYRHSAYWAAGAINDSLDKLHRGHLGDAMRSHSLFRVPFWTKIPSGECDIYSLVTVGILRSKGIPAVNDFILQWATKTNNHSWVTLLTDTQRPGYLEGCEGKVLGFMRPGECKGKVYRRTYAPDKGLIRLNTEAVHVPSTLRTIFMKDVTAEYVRPVNVTVKPLPELRQNHEKYAYLAVYGNYNWVPVCYARTEDEQACFKDMERGAVYLPAYYTEKGLQPANYPFLLTQQEKIKYLKPDKQHTRSMTLHRKFPLTTKAFNTGRCITGSLIQAANHADFSDAVTLHRFDKFTVAGYVDTNDSIGYRYWRYFCPNPCYCYLAELAFFDNQGNKMTGDIIGTGQRQKDDVRYSREAAFDDDPFTYYISNLQSGGWIGMDFGKPVRINKVGYLARGDDNNIRVGDEYELYYWDLNGWVSLGKQRATIMSLTFNHVPDNALLILRDHTRGKEERIFLYEDNEQIWY